MTAEGGERIVRVACVQMEPEIAVKEKNVAVTVARIKEAAAAGARLIVLPELCNTGYVFRDRDEAMALAEPVPSGPTCDRWSEIAANLDLHLVAGINERDGEDLFNSAVIIGPDGYLATYRKIHLWDKENLIFKPGNLGFPVVNTPVGNIGTFICYDTWFANHTVCVRFKVQISSVCRPTGTDSARSSWRWLIYCVWPQHIRMEFLLPPLTGLRSARPLSDKA